MFGEDVDLAARNHAMRKSPNECCAVIKGGKYIECENIADNPQRSFKIKPDLLIGAEAIVHSHVAQNGDGPHPSALDMQGMIRTAIPWGIVWTNGKAAHGPLWLGDHLLDVPLLGRKFMHGVFDCYSLVRSWRWQKFKIKMPEFPRDNEWWKKRDGIEPKDLISESMEAAGCFQIDTSEAKENDILIMQIGARVPNHCAVLEANNLILHHAGGSPENLSKREPLNNWQRFVRRAVRFAA
jgi:cell wall-associated NlpC family hydrolase